MSGFELLSVVRTRFPQIPVVAISSDYTALNLPDEVVTDAFIDKNPNTEFELVESVRRLISESPIRASKPKSGYAPVWVSRSTSGYVIVTCPECLRSFSIRQPQTENPIDPTCVFCDANVALIRSNFASVGTRLAGDSSARSRKWVAES